MGDLLTTALRSKQTNLPVELPPGLLERITQQEKRDEERFNNPKLDLNPGEGVIVRVRKVIQGDFPHPLVIIDRLQDFDPVSNLANRPVVEGEKKLAPYIVARMMEKLNEYGPDEELVYRDGDHPRKGGIYLIKRTTDTKTSKSPRKECVVIADATFLAFDE